MPPPIYLRVTITFDAENDWYMAEAVCDEFTVQVARESFGAALLGVMEETLNKALDQREFSDDD